ncbi:hypothetical protein BS78_01G005600 [Paspalum vaginatum]|nr:hypothetical protein BS78_01G005600 [Paspalum vaginatum]
MDGRDALSVQTSSFAGDITFSKETPITPRPNVVPDHDFLGKTSTFLTDHSKSNSSCAMSLNLDDAIGATNSLHCPTIPVNAATRSSHCAANDGSSPTPNHLPTVTTQPSTDSPSKDTPQSPTTLTPPPESKCGEGPTTDSVAPVAPIPEKRVPWRRLTKVPPKYCSPFKFGVKSRKPPDRVRSLSMLDYVCDYDSPLKNLPVMRFAKMDFSGELIANSFFHENFIQSHFVTAFVECLSFDDFHERPECHGYRIFLDPMVSSCLYDGSMERDTQDPGFMMQEAVHLIKQCLPNNCDLKKAKMIFLPILARRQWSVYCVNLGQRRIDVLDSKDYSQCNTTWQEYHDTLGNTIIPRLSDALNLAAPRQFISFIHWRHAPVQLAYHSNDNDSGVFAIRFLEYYDGEGHGSLKTTVHPDRSMEMRADILHYLCFHSNNGISPIPDALLKFRDV